MRVLVVVLPALVVLAVLIIVVLRTGTRPVGRTGEHRRRAVRAQARFHEVVRHTPPGPLRERLSDLGASVDAAAAEAVRVADIAAAVEDSAIRGDESVPARRLEHLVDTLERAVGVAGDLAVAGTLDAARLDDELAALHAALRELGPGEP